MLPTEQDVSRQNDEESLDLLCAEESYKRHARRLQAAALLTAGLAAALGVVASVFKSFSTTAALVGVAATVTVLLLDRAQSRSVASAAAIKDAFDARFFGIPLSTLNRDLPSREEILHRAGLVLHRRDALRDWYPDPSGVSVGFGRLLCQRASVVWDLRLRVRASRLMLSLSAAISIGSLLAGVLLDLSLTSFLVSYVAPLSAIMTTLVQNGWRNLEAAKERKQILEVIEAAWRASSETGSDVPFEHVRTVQDAVLRIRASAPVIPRLLQWKLDSRFWSEMSVASERLKSELPASQGGVP